jgi:hypothetical protein
MPKFKTRRPRVLPFRLLLIVAGALLLMAALAPRANAIVLIYFNFEDAPAGGPYDPASDDVPPLGDNPGGGIQHSTITDNFLPDAAASVDGLLANRTAGDIDTAVPGHAIGFRATVLDNGHWIQFSLNASAYSSMSLSFAVNSAGNGFNTVTLQFSTTGPGGPFAPVGTQGIAPGPTQVKTFALPAGANFQPSLTLRLVWAGGTSNGNNLETVVDNIQLIGVPEPTTVAGGLLGVLGLLWFQRRRLICCVRFRRT